MLSRRVAASLPWGTLVAATVVGGLGWAVHGRRGLRLDRWADHRLIGAGPKVHHVAFWLRDIGNPFQFTCLLGAALVVWALCAGPGPAITQGCAVVLDVVLIEYVLKPLIGRDPPYGHGNTFPSGHTGAAFGLATTVAILLLQPAVARHLARLVRLALGLVLFAVAAGVGVAMVVTRAHYFTDVIGGFPIGIMMPLLSAGLYDRIARRRSAGEPRIPKVSGRTGVAGRPADPTALNSARR